MLPTSSENGTLDRQRSLSSHVETTQSQPVETVHAALDLPGGKRPEKVTHSEICARSIKSTSDMRRQQLTNIRQAMDIIDRDYYDINIACKIQDAITDLDKIINNRMPLAADFPESVKTVASELVCRLVFPGNNQALQILAENGVGLKKLTFYHTFPSPLLLKQFLENTDKQTATKIIAENISILILNSKSGYMALLEAYLSKEEIETKVQTVLNAISDGNVNLSHYNQECRFSDDAAPCLLPALFNSLHSTITKAEAEDCKEGAEEITNIICTKSALTQLCLLQNHSKSHEQLTLAELQKLPVFNREKLLCCSFLLGQGKLFELLSKTLSSPPQVILIRHFDKEGNPLHYLAYAISEDFPHQYPDLLTYSPDYDQLMQFIPATLWANQKDSTGAFPITLLYKHNKDRFTYRPLLGPDNNLVIARRNCLLKLSAPESLNNCIQSCFMDFLVDIDEKWFYEFLLLYRQLQTTEVSVSVHLTEESGRFYNDKSEIYPIVRFFLEHPDVLRNKQNIRKLMALMQQEKQPLEYQAQVLRVISPDVQKYFLTSLFNTQDKWNETFIEQNYKLFYKIGHFYPWHWLAQGEVFEPLSPELPYIAPFLEAVKQYQLHLPKDTSPPLPNAWEKELLSCSDVIIYGRSLACPSRDVPTGYRRFKFLKRLPDAIEEWESFIREQPHLAFFRKHRASLGLESALLKPMGVYRMTDSLKKFKTMNLPNETLSGIAIEPDGSAYVQVLDDDEDTRLYHRYPYDIEGEDGLSITASFEGLRLFARDAARLSREGFQAPDILATFHNSEDVRGWVPTPFFNGRSVPGTLGEWSAQDYPNIAPAPVGVRDWADIRAFCEHTSANFGVNPWFDSTPAEVQSRLRITEIGKTFYGLVINWLRVRHDTNRLDYKNPQHMTELSEELTLISSELFGIAHGQEPGVIAEKIRSVFPKEALGRTALECGYWCDPNFRYVEDFKSGRFPEEIYPNHPDKDLHGGQLRPDDPHLTSQGIRRSTLAKGPNLGIDTGTMPLCHLDSLFWFCILIARFFNESQ